MYRIVFTLILTIASLGASGVAQAGELKISHLRPQGATIDRELRTFAEALKTATGGSLDLRIFAASTLGDYTVVQERLSVGDVDMAVQPMASNIDRRMQIVTLPYLALNWAEARRIYGPDGAMRRVATDLYAEQGITVLAAYPVYFGGISLNREPVAPGDVSVDKGIKVRVPGFKSFQLLGIALGYISSPIPFADAFTAVQTGVVDGVIGAGAEGYNASFRDVTKSYIPMNTHFETWYMIINSETFAGLDPVDRAALQAAATDFETKRWTRAEADQAVYEQKLAEQGAKIYTVSAAQLSAAAVKVRQQVWPVILQDVGEAWARGVLKDVLKEPWEKAAGAMTCPALNVQMVKLSVFGKGGCVPPKPKRQTQP